MRRSVPIAVVALIAGVAAGIAFESRRRTSDLVGLRAALAEQGRQLEAMARRAPARLRPPAAADCDATLIARLVLEGLDAESRPSPPEASHDSRERATDLAPEPSDAFTQGVALLEAGVRAGFWDTGNADALRALLPSMTDEERQRVFRRFSRAVNAGELEVENPGLPF